MKKTKAKVGSICAYLLLFSPTALTSHHVFADTLPSMSSDVIAEKKVDFDLPQNTLAAALIEFGVQANVVVIVPFELVEGYTSSPIVGYYTLQRALDKLLWRAPLGYRIETNTHSQAIIIQPKEVEHSEALVSSAVLSSSPLVEELVVTGIRASLTKSINIKRMSDGIIDAISAEDIGKFPDTNLAESLQRITGVSISRNNGEGATVTVRGFGESYNLVTLNGRTMPAALAPPNAVANTRAFDFSNLASEGVSGVDVYKTSNASIPTGGVGATINIKTAKPMDVDGFKSYLGVKGVADATQRQGREITPEVSGLLSWTDNQKWGVSVFGSMQERDSGSSGAFVDQWITAPWVPLGEAGALATHSAACQDINGNAQLDQCSTLVNAPQVGQLYSIPTHLHYTITDSARSRVNSQLTLQWKPLENITSTLDYSYSENSIQGSRSEQSTRFTGNRSYLVFDNETVKTPVLSTETIFDSSGQPSAKGLAFAQQAFDTTNKNTSLGLNIDFEVSETFALTLDAHDSSAVSGPGQAEYGSWANVSIGANVVGAQTTDWRGDLPITAITLNDILLAPYGSNDGVFDAKDIGTQVAFAYYSQQQTDVNQIQLKGIFEWTTMDVEFGIDMKNMESHSLYSETYYTMGDWGITDPDKVPDQYFTPRNFANEFSDFDTQGMFTEGFNANAKEITDWAVTEYSQVFPDAFRYSNLWDEDRTIKEHSIAFYAQVTMDFDLMDVPVDVVAGIRHEQTDIESIVNAIPAEVVWLDNNDFNTVYTNKNVSFSKQSNYSHLLPSLDVTFDVTSHLKARFAYSKTIARADYNQLSASVSGFDVPGVSIPGQINAIALEGNPSLKPLQSNNVDLSLEFYLNEVSYVSLGAYWKYIDNFIGTRSEIKTHFDLRDSSSGPRSQAAIAQLEAAPDFDGTITPTDLFNQIVSTQYSLTNTTGDDSFFGDTYDIHAQVDDPLYQVTTFSPANNKNAAISGLEFAVQHFFGESGFGVLLNYTTVNGDVKYDVTAQSSATQFALIGLSDTMNAVAMFEKFGFQARLAYNWRDAFLAYLSDEPKFTEAYSQVDITLSYTFKNSLSVSLEGLNLTEENSRQHGRSRAQLWQLEQLGARYMFGVRYSF